MREPFVVKLATGETFTLRYPFSAIRRFEKLSGGHFFSDSINRLGAEYIVSLIAAGVGAHCKPDDVEKKLDAHLDAGGELPDILTQTTEALKAWGILNRDEEEGEDNLSPPVPIEATDRGD
jgi:hypothetical protein